MRDLPDRMARVEATGTSERNSKSIAKTVCCGAMSVAELTAYAGMMTGEERQRTTTSTAGPRSIDHDPHPRHPPRRWRRRSNPGVCSTGDGDVNPFAGAHLRVADYAAPLKAAITAHVEAEVAWRLAAAPDVEAAIVRHDDDTYWRGYRHGGGKVPPDWEDVPRDDHALRVAIAADKARRSGGRSRRCAPAPRRSARYVTAWGCVPGGSEEWKARNQDRVEDELRGDPARA